MNSFIEKIFTVDEAIISNRQPNQNYDQPFSVSKKLYMIWLQLYKYRKEGGNFSLNNTTTENVHYR
jgi:hypothetical protein